MKRLKLGIRPQLIILVFFSSLFSLLILAVVTAVYFSNSLSNSRAERLEVIAELKSTQVKQALQYTFYQINWLTTRDTLVSALTLYRAGNYSRAVFSEAQTTLDQLLISSESFGAARLYNLDLDVVADSYNNLTAITNSTMDVLFPIAKNATIPSQLQTATSSADAYYTGPVSNGTNVFGSYFIGITLPVFANTSIIFQEPTLAGFLTVLAKADNIQISINDTSAFSKSRENSVDYQVVAVRPIYSSPSGSFSTIPPANESSMTISGFQTIFPAEYGSEIVAPNTYQNINSSSAMKTALTKGHGSATNVRSVSGEKLAIGYSDIRLQTNVAWTIVIEQPKHVFYAPVNKLSDIIIGVVIGTGVFMCLITFPLAVWFIRPITKLRNATESIAKSKLQYNKLKQGTNSASLTSVNSSHRDSYHKKENESTTDAPNNALTKRNSVQSVATGTTISAHSTAIRLPGKIPDSKKFLKDELTELTDAFNIMTDELDKQYTHLEDRVKMRTKELEASKIEAEAANEAKTVFIANISHELRTPLNGILGMTSIAMDEEDHTRIQDSLKLIHRSGELLLHILTELLTYSKNTLNRSKLEKSNFQILEVVYQVKSIFTKLALDQRVNFKILLKPNVLRKLILFGDSNRIIQIVMNLVSNSLKFTPVDGSVGVTFKLLGEYDFEKSASEDFEKVHVLKNSRHKKESPNSSDGQTTLFNKSSNLSTLHKTNDTSPDIDTKNHNKKLPDIISETNQNFNNNNENDNADNISVITLSTTEYENNIFESQFNHHKPLPNLPSHTSSLASLRNQDSSSLINGRLDQKLDSRTSIDSKASDSGKPAEGKSKQQYPKLLPPVMKGNSINKAPQEPDRSQRRISLDSHMSKHELVKNDKVFKIRSMYKPKTWAIQIEVTDSGPGIEPSLQEKVFEPFIQGDQTLSRSYGGTGLGLSICRQLAKMMKGTLTLKSEFGHGSTFTFTVPLPQTGEIVVPDEEMADFCDDEYNPKSRVNRKVAFERPEGDEDNEETETSHNYSDENITATNGEYEPTTQDSPTISITRPVHEQGSDNSSHKNTYNSLEISSSKSLEKPRLVARSSTGTANSGSTVNERNDSQTNLLEHSDIRILVAEDNMVNQEVIKRMLHLEGFHNVTLACNGAEAVELVRESIDNYMGYDMILMDVQMPKIDGLSATKMIRNELHYDRPIVALTAFADESNVKECLNSGMSGFLAKPIRRANLKKTIVKFSPHSKE